MCIRDSLHTVYTHGYGLVAAYGNRRQAGGEPEWLAKNIPTVGPLTADQPRIYYGELASDYVVVGRESGQSAIEFDTPGGGDATGEQFKTAPRSRRRRRACRTRSPTDRT